MFAYADGVRLVGSCIIVAVVRRQMCCFEVRRFLLWKLAEVERLEVWRSADRVKKRGDVKYVREMPKKKKKKMDEKEERQAQEGKKKGLIESWQVLGEPEQVESVKREAERWGQRERQQEWRREMRGRGRIMKDINSIPLYWWPVRFARLKQHRWVSD